MWSKHNCFNFYINNLYVCICILYTYFVMLGQHFICFFNFTLREMQQGVRGAARGYKSNLCMYNYNICNNLCIYKYKQKACLNTLIEKELCVNATRRRLYGKLTFCMEYFQPIQCKFFINNSLFNKIEIHANNTYITKIWKQLIIINK